MNSKRKTQTEVLDYLAEHFPALHKAAEVDRDWVWLVVDLSGEVNKTIREAIGKKGLGFRFAKRGHVLENGTVGTWGHSCQRPMPFKRRGDGKWERKSKEPETTGDESQDLETEIMAVLSAA